uniref:AB hydrolase-1 domain-containing protein n=1 Tax=Davidia involucrata TaxID=16924 RepID=A0A5B7C177_DAVIN
MSEVNDSRPWGEEFVSLVGDTGMRYAAAPGGGGGIGIAAAAVEEDFGVRGGGGNAGIASESWKYQAVEFLKGLAEMSVEFGRGCRDIVKQNIMTEDCYVVKKFGGPCAKVGAKLTFLNEYLPEDRNPVHAWTVICLVSIIALSALNVNTEHDTTTPFIKKVYIHPPNASRILLPDGRHLAYQEQGVSADRARFSMIAPHSFLSSRLAGIPGLKTSVLLEFGIRLVTYDLPGFGESDPHPSRNLESSALDMLHLSYAVGVTDKFWVVGYSSGSMHVWAALRYIPDRIAGAAMVAPMVNPYELSMTKEERYKSWEKWTPKRKIMYFLARRFPRFLTYFYRRSFLSGKHGQIDKWLSLSLGKGDRALVEKPMFEEFWQRDVEESVRQGNVKPFVEEAALQVSNWGFCLADLKIQKKGQGKGIILWLKSMFSQAEEELTGFLGPIYIWQGMDDMVVPPSMTNFVERVLPGVMVHRLLYEGHFTYFYFCDECHRQIFSSLFRNPEGPLPIEIDQTPIQEDNEDTEEVTLGDSAMD